MIDTFPYVFNMKLQTKSNHIEGFVFSFFKFIQISLNQTGTMKVEVFSYFLSSSLNEGNLNGFKAKIVTEFDQKDYSLSIFYGA